MPTRSLSCTALLALLLAGGAPAAIPQDVTVQTAITHARDRVMPHVVSILVVREDFAAGEPKLSVGSGSGSVITAAGHVVTNAHVTDRGRSFRVVFGDGREREAVLIGEDSAADLAVLKLSGEPTPMPYARFATAAGLQSGDTVLAMGAPWGLSNSLSAGVVNNPRRLLVSLFEDEADYEDRIDTDLPTGRYYAWIQHDAAIAPGNSGGPLVNLQGEIVGVNTRGMLFGGDLAFAIPADDVKAVVTELIEHGQVLRSHLGLRLRSLRGSGESSGVWITAVQDQGPAARSGLRPGDRLLALDGQPLDALLPVDVPAIHRRIAGLAPDRAVRLDLARGDQRKTLVITPERQGRERGERAAFAPFGLAVVALTPAMAERRNLPLSSGLLVDSLRAGGPASQARPPIAPGAVLLAIDGQPLRTPADLETWRRPRTGNPPLVVELFAAGERRLALLTPAHGDRTREPLPELPQSWVGAEVQPIPESLAGPLGLPAAGFRITRLYPGAPLAQGGAQVGDLLTRLQGQPLPAINDTRADLFERRVREYAIGQNLAFEGYREGRPMRWQASTRPAPLPATSLRSIEISALRAQFRELGFFDRVERELAVDHPGVLVQTTEPGGAAGLAHLRAGDVLLRIGDHRIDRLEALAPALRSLSRQQHPLPLHILRGNEARILLLDPAWMTEPPG